MSFNAIKVGNFNLATTNEEPKEENGKPLGCGWCAFSRFLIDKRPEQSGGKSSDNANHCVKKVVSHGLTPFYDILYKNRARREIPIESFSISSSSLVSGDLSNEPAMLRAVRRAPSTLPWSRHSAAYRNRLINK